jgi:phage tail-like protein
MAGDDPIGAHSFSLDIQGMDSVTFAEATGFDNKSEAIEFRDVDKSGKMTIRKTFGAPKWGEITLKRGFTKDTTLWDLRQKVLDGDHVSARKNGTITGRDAAHKPVISFTFENGWVSSWKSGNFSAKANEVAMEEITITHEGLKRVL